MAESPEVRAIVEAAAERIQAAIQAEKEALILSSGCDDAWLSSFVVMTQWTTDSGRTWCNRVHPATQSDITTNGLLFEGLHKWPETDEDDD